MSAELLPVFLKLRARRVLLVGGGRVAASKLHALLAAGARVEVVAPDVRSEIVARAARVSWRGFEPEDVRGAWYVLAAATPEVNRAVAAAAESERVFVNAVDDPQNASAYLGAVLRRGGVTVSISTAGAAPGLAGLLREGFEQLLPEEVGDWTILAGRLRAEWKAAALPLERRRPLLLEALNRAYAGRERAALEAPAVSAAVGCVALVGAGPGDPELLTRRAAQRLAEAELVLFDALVDARVLELAPQARRFCVGKRAGRASVRQETIERLMIRAARRGLRVVRLKCGDPFVLGRGGEELVALRAAGVPCEVVPGLTNAVAAPALSGIPVTHRGLASSFVVVSGHEPRAYRPVLESLPPGASTLVVLMGLRTRAALAGLLLGRGWSAATPAAVCLAAGGASARAWVGSLGELGAAVLGEASDPGTIVIGDVVSLAREWSRREALPASVVA